MSALSICGVENLPSGTIRLSERLSALSHAFGMTEKRSAAHLQPIVAAA